MIILWLRILFNSNKNSLVCKTQILPVILEKKVKKANFQRICIISLENSEKKLVSFEWRKLCRIPFEKSNSWKSLRFKKCQRANWIINLQSSRSSQTFAGSTHAEASLQACQPRGQRIGCPAHLPEMLLWKERSQKRTSYASLTECRNLAIKADFNWGQSTSFYVQRNCFSHRFQRICYNRSVFECFLFWYLFFPCNNKFKSKQGWKPIRTYNIVNLLIVPSISAKK